MKATIQLARAAMALAAGLALQASAETELGSGDTVQLSLQSGEASNEFYVNVPAGTTHMELLLEGDKPQQQDVDLFLRYGEPFDLSSNPFPQANYYAIGDNAVEPLEVTYASSPPVSPGRWYIGIVNAGNNASDATLSVNLRAESRPDLRPLDIQIAYTDDNGKGFFDQSPFTPHSGNDANTLGKARRNAFEKAIEILEQSYTSPVPIVIAAGFDQRRGENNEEVCPSALACAGPTSVAYDFPGAQVAGTWYPRTSIPRLAGTDYCRLGFESCKNPREDVFVSFNKESDFDGGWWYGLERNPQFFASRQYDFIATAMHEILHGLGFLTFVDVRDGSKFNGRDDIYLKQLRWNRNGNLRNVSNLTNQQRVNAFTSGPNLYWTGEKAQAWWDEVTSSGEIIDSTPSPYVFAPFEVNPGSSVSHVSFADLMNYVGNVPTGNDDINIREPGEELGAAYFFLRDMGWDEDPKPLIEGAVAPELGMWFDKARDGHGFDLQKSGSLYFLTFFTYGEDGLPEWYLAVGTVVEGVFSGTLERFAYDPGANPPQSGESAGEVEIEFGVGPGSSACDDGTDRSGAVQLARFSWTIDGESGDWCVQPLIDPADAPPPPDFSGHWFAGDADGGWGLTVYQYGSGLFAVLYFYDAEGNPRWMLGLDDDWTSGDSITMEQFDGFCRTCTPESTTSEAAGTLVLDLTKPSQVDDEGNSTTVDVTWQGTEGGDWQRMAVPIKLLSDPAG